MIKKDLKTIKKHFYANSQRAITLIALVITIIVLLVLAAVSINTLFNDNGIINSASKGGDKYKMEAVREQI